MSTHRRTDEKIVVHKNENKQPTTTYKIMDESHKFNIEHKKPDAKEVINRIQAEGKLIYGDRCQDSVCLERGRQTEVEGFWGPGSVLFLFI